MSVSCASVASIVEKYSLLAMFCGAGVESFLLRFILLGCGVLEGAVVVVRSGTVIRESGLLRGDCWVKAGCVIRRCD